MVHLAVRLNLLNKVHSDPAICHVPEEAQLADRILVAENSLSEFCSKLLLLAART
jgi:hypothetical protein